MKIHCPQCRGIFRVEGRASGTDFACPFCKASFSFRDKETVVATHSPETVVRVEREDALAPAIPPATPRESAGQADGAGPVAGDGQTAGDERTQRDTVPTPEPTQSSDSRTDAADLTDLRIGDTVNDAYRLDSIIGCGGMSVVFKAKQLSLDRDVALKVLRRDLSKDVEFSQRFLKEAQALAELSHPNIVQVFDQGVFRNNHYLVMEFIDGVSIREVLNERRLTPEEALQLIPELCGALEYAHSRGIVHRDIKPENLMLTQGGVPKIADFGLVRMLGDHSSELSRLTKTQTILGTLEYMSPEQREGHRDIDHRADIYSLGVVFYEMLTGELPIARFPLPSEKVEVDVRLDDVVLKVLAKDRDRRYQRASMVATDISNLGNVHASGGGTNTAPTRAQAGPRLLLMAQSPLFFIFSLVYMLIALGRHDAHEFVHGVAIPFYLSQLTLHGILPRMAVPRHLFVYRHPVIFFGLLVFFTAMVDPRDVGPVLCGAFASAGLCVWRWRKSIFRQDGEPRFLLPPHAPSAVAATAASATASAAAGAWSARPNARQHEARNDAAREQHASATTIAQSPVPPSATPQPATPQSAMPQPAGNAAPGNGPVAKEVSAGAQTATDGAAASDDPATPERTRLSLLAVLAFLATLVTLVYTSGVLVASRVDWSSVAMYSELDHGDVSEALQDGLWRAPRWAFDHARLVSACALVVPLLFPVLLALLALIPLQSPNKRGGLLVGIACVFLMIQWGVVLKVSGKIGRTAEEYRHNLENGGTMADAFVSAQSAAPEESLTRLSMIHRAVYLGRSGATPPANGRYAMLDVATNRNLPPTERIAALVALQDIYGRRLFVDVDGQPLTDWISTFSTAAAETTDRRVRESFLQLLSHCTASAPKKLFFEALASRDSRLGPLAVRWWTGAAPLEAVHWLGQRYRELPPRTLVEWIDRLERSGNRRFHDEPALRQALLGPLLESAASEYDCTFDERVSELIHSGPERWSY